MESYRTVYQGGTGEVMEKKSRFIATVKPVESKEEAECFVEECKKKYWDARHNCSAYVIGSKGEIVHSSDDGEPGGTAGRPMLEVLQGEKLCNVVMVVTRYFGGTLLGTGGLVRAYQKAAKEALNNSVIISKKKGVKLEIVIDYNEVGKIQYCLGQNKYSVLESKYMEKVAFIALIPILEIEHCKKQVIQLTGGKAELEQLEEVYYDIIEGKIVLFMS